MERKGGGDIGSYFLEHCVLIGSMVVQLPALLGNYDRTCPTNRPKDRQEGS